MVIQCEENVYFKITLLINHKAFSVVRLHYCKYS